MPYSESDRDTKVRKRLEAWNVFQFGQPADNSTFSGATACTHVCWQRINYIWTGRKVSIDGISKLAGYYREYGSNGPRGLNVAESKRVIDKLNLPYVYKSNMPWEDLWEAIDRGPVLYATRYGSQPDWRGYSYRGVRADGSPNGFAWKAGRTQLVGFENGAHAVLGCAKRYLKRSDGTNVRLELLRHDPNHGSSARPEKPPYDLISSKQGRKEYEDLHNRLGRSLSAFVPTRSLPA